MPAFLVFPHHIPPGNGQLLSLWHRLLLPFPLPLLLLRSAARAKKMVGKHGTSRRYCSACRSRCQSRIQLGCHGCTRVTGQLKHGLPEGNHRRRRRVAAEDHRMSCWKWHGHRRPRRHALRLHDRIHRRGQADGHRLHLVLQQFHVKHLQKFPNFFSENVVIPKSF